MERLESTRTPQATGRSMMSTSGMFVEETFRQLTRRISSVFPQTGTSVSEESTEERPAVTDLTQLLSDEILLLIFSFLGSAKELVKGSWVCHRWHTLCLDNSLWASLCEKLFGFAPPPSKKLVSIFPLLRHWVQTLARGNWQSTQITRPAGGFGTSYVRLRTRQLQEGKEWFEYRQQIEEACTLRPVVFSNQDPMAVLICEQTNTDIGPDNRMQLTIVEANSNHLSIKDLPNKCPTSITVLSSNYPKEFTILVRWQQIRGSSAEFFKVSEHLPRTRYERLWSSRSYRAESMSITEDGAEWHRTTITIGKERYLARVYRGNLRLHSIDEGGLPSSTPTWTLPDIKNRLDKMVTCSALGETLLVALDKLGNLFCWSLSDSEAIVKWKSAAPVSSPSNVSREAVFMIVPKASETEEDLLLSYDEHSRLTVINPVDGKTLHNLNIPSFDNLPSYVSKIDTFASRGGDRYVVALVDGKIHIWSLQGTYCGAVPARVKRKASASFSFAIVHSPTGPVLVTTEIGVAPQVLKTKTVTHIHRWMLLKGETYALTHLGTDRHEYADQTFLLSFQSYSGFDALLYLVAQKRMDKYLLMRASLWDFNKPEKKALAWLP